MRTVQLLVQAVVVGCAAATVVACSGSSSSTGSGSASVSGSVGGQSVQTTSVVAVVGSETTNGTTVQLASVLMTSVADACSFLQNPTHRIADSSYLLLSGGAIGPSVPTGTYNIGQYGYAQYGSDSATCMLTTVQNATSGSITISSISSSTVQGTFDLTMANGDHLSGSFDAPVCMGVTYQGLQQAEMANLPCQSP